VTPHRGISLGVLRRQGKAESPGRKSLTGIIVNHTPFILRAHLETSHLRARNKRFLGNNDHGRLASACVGGDRSKNGRLMWWPHMNTIAKWIPEIGWVSVTTNQRTQKLLCHCAVISSLFSQCWRQFVFHCKALLEERRVQGINTTSIT
jgi:hypothetical protein